MKHSSPPPDPSSIPARLAYPVTEACSLLGDISRKSIYDLMASGELRSVYIAGRRLIPAGAIEELIASRTEGFVSAARGRNPGAVAPEAAA